MRVRLGFNYLKAHVDHSGGICFHVTHLVTWVHLRSNYSLIGVRFNLSKVSSSLNFQLAPVLTEILMHLELNSYVHGRL